VLAVFAGVMELVPILGPALGAIPAVLVALTISTEKAIWVVVATAIIQLAENYLLVPQIMKRFVGVSPVINLLALITMGSILGVPGALLAIPTAAVLQPILHHWITSRQAASWKSGVGIASRLR
jgi:predicted PurR-regulated permease PerM